MLAVTSLVFTAVFILCAVIFIALWQFAVKPDASHRTRVLNLFGATTVCLAAGIVLAFVTRDHLLAPFMIIAGIAYMLGWAQNLDVFAPKSVHPHGNEQFMEQYDQREPHLTAV